nr:C10 family peptidase [Paludibacteraceae bacterium]
MKARIRMRSLAVMVFAVMAMGAFAQSDVRVSKVLRAQKMGKQTVLRSTDSRLPQEVVRFDREEDVTNMPQELRDFLSSYEEALRRMDEGADISQVLSVDPHAAYQTIVVGPLLDDIEFDQGTPYNDKCPIINNARAITGCVATAMAEIMRYWKYPAVGKGSTTYTGSKGAQTYNFADHPFDWNNMLPTYKR